VVKQPWVCLEAERKGIWKDFDVEIVGVDVNAINITEDENSLNNCPKNKCYHRHLLKYVRPT
jgi:hypothetical protein